MSKDLKAPWKFDLPCSVFDMESPRNAGRGHNDWGTLPPGGCNPLALYQEGGWPGVWFDSFVPHDPILD